MPCIRVCLTDLAKSHKDDNRFEGPRKIWEEWDLRILVLYILFTQIYLHFFGRHRRKSTSWVLMNLNVWFLYLFSDLLATIALGKLSKVKVDDSCYNINTTSVSKVERFHVSPVHKKKHPQPIRSLWAPVILFYLGGPDTMTILRLEEKHLWVRHLIGLLTQGLRTLYVLIVTWTPCGLSVLALLLLIPGIIKYGERVWVIQSRARKKYQGFIKLDESKIDNVIDRAPNPNAKLVLQAYFWFQTLQPHIPDVECNRARLKSLVTSFRKLVKTGAKKMGTRGTVIEHTTIENSFKLIEIELGMIYDMLFSKVGTIFTFWECILRSISFSCLVAVFVTFFLIEMPPEQLEGDLPITIILLIGAIFLDIAGVLAQLVSDWVIVWACKYPGRLATLVLCLHDGLNSKRKRWSGLMGQFNFLNYCKEYRPTMFNKRLSRFGSSREVEHSVKNLIILHLFKESQEVAGASQQVEVAGASEEVAVAGASQQVEVADASQEVAGAGASKEAAGASQEAAGVGASQQVEVAGASQEVAVAGASKEVAGSSQEVAGAGASKEAACASQEAAGVSASQQVEVAGASQEVVVAGASQEVAGAGAGAGAAKEVAGVSQEVAGASQTLTIKRGERSIEKYNFQEFKWSVELEFNRSIVIWHLATDVCFHLEDPNVDMTDKMEAAKVLSNYMMYLLLMCPSRFPFCNMYVEFKQDYGYMKEIVGGGSRWSDKTTCQVLLANASSATVVNHVQELAKGLREKEDRWEIISNVWVEMLCYASSQCLLKHHVQELRHGGEFLTHVWLLLMHFGVEKRVERTAPNVPKDEHDAAIKTSGQTIKEYEEILMEP